MTPLRQKLLDDLTIRGLSENTQKSYTEAVIGLARYYRRSPDQLTAQEVQDYLLYLLRDRKLTPNTCSAAVPIFALSLLVGSVLLTQGPYDGGALVTPQSRVEVSKAGENVVFVIHNGDRAHTVSKSTNPAAGGEGETFTTTTGRFDDRLDSGAEIVYYRID